MYANGIEGGSAAEVAEEEEGGGGGGATVPPASLPSGGGGHLPNHTTHAPKRGRAELSLHTQRNWDTERITQRAARVQSSLAHTRCTAFHTNAPLLCTK
jgi:hypothetical protein